MKQLEKTPFIRSVLSAIVGVDVDVDRLAVFEAIATSTIPLRGKDGTLFERAVIAPVTLHQLAQAANNEGAPLMMDHNMSGTPKGKFFYGEVMPQESGQTELRGLFYVDPVENDLLAKVDGGTADEVSIAFLPDKINCSQCGFDYKAEADSGNIVPMLLRTCDNGHEVGTDGTHVILNGVSDLLELSVVSRGAAKNSKIVGQTNAMLAKDVQRLAANGLDINQLYVTASAEKGQNDMDLTQLVSQLTDTKAELSVSKTDRDRLETELAKAVGERNTAQARVTELEAELANSPSIPEVDEIKEERKEAAKVSEEAKAAADFLSGQYVAVLTAAGKTDIKAPDTIPELIAGIKEHKAELSAVLPIDGRSQGKGEENEETVKSNLDVFRVKRN